MKKVLIFGTGFIATSLIQYYKNKNIECIVMYNKHKIEDYPDIKHYSMDDDVENIFQAESPEFIILLHGNSFVSANTNIKDSIMENTLKVTSFLEKIYKKNLYENIKKILMVGSASEYGKFYNSPIEEDFELHPTSIYGLSKIFLYNTAKYFIEKGLPIVYIRQFNTVGAGQRDCFVLSGFAKSIVSIEKGLQEAILNVGDLSQERDFLDIRDTCIAYDILIRKGVLGEVYNVASNTYISIQTLLNEVIAQSSIDSNNLKVNKNKNLFSKEKSLSKRLHADTRKLELLGFKRKYQLRDMVKSTLEYWRKNV